MEQNIDNYDFGLKDANVKILKKDKCNQCDYTASQAGNLKRHLKAHSGEKSNKCNQCNFASSYASVLKEHLKKHNGEKANKCNQCDYASFYASALRTHLKTHSGVRERFKKKLKKN